MKFPYLYFFIIIIEGSLRRTRHLDYGELKYIANELDPTECFYLIVYLTKRDVHQALRQLGKENFSENWNEISNSHCLKSLVNWNRRISKSLSRGLLKKALHKLGKSDLVAHFNEGFRSSSSERKIKQNEFLRNINSRRNSNNRKEAEIIEYNGSNVIIYMMTGSLIILIFFGFSLLILYIRATRSNFHLRNFEIEDKKRKNCCHETKLNVDSSGVESEDSSNQSIIIKEIKHTPKQKMNNSHKYSKKRIKILSPILKIKKLFTGNTNEENKRQNRVKYKGINKNFCLIKENRKKAKKCKDKMKSKNSDIKKVSSHKFNEICTCEMCQLFNIGEDKFADIREVNNIRSRKKQRRKIRKKFKENTDRN